MGARGDGTRTFAHTCARTIAGMAIDRAAMVCVVVATQAEGSVTEIDASTAIYGPGEPPPGLIEFARRLRPAIEAVARELAKERGEGFERRLDLERELEARDAQDAAPDDEGAQS